MKKIQNYVNHIALVVDASGSMSGLSNKVVEVFDKELRTLKQRSVELNQETRISIYLFNSTIECLVFDMDVMRFESLRGYYETTGSTALIGGTVRAITDMQKLPELYGDHAFLTYVITDGEENVSSAIDKTRFRDLSNNFKENWTLACLVPNQRALFEAKKFGFPAEAISIWDTSERGLETVGTVFTSSMETYMQNRAVGVRGTRSFFNQVNAKDLTRDQVKGSLSELPAKRYSIILNDYPKAAQIKSLVEEKLPTNYVVGTGYYALVKKETVQAKKQIIIQDAKNGKVYAGTDARTLLGIPSGETQVAPGDFGMWNIFVQSTSPVRNIIPNQKVLVLHA